MDIAIYKNRKIVTISNYKYISIPKAIYDAWKDKYGEDFRVTIRLLEDGKIVVEPEGE